ncbi:MAG: glutamine synthetase III, partial [Kiritimatiellaeota bacterium]|nr:glutamine synthetase III [Kiritimatiellota bacterium]
MRGRLSERAFLSLMSTIHKHEPLDPSIAGEVAEAMKDWAVQHGATHYTHWFQPLSGTTAEKQNAFLSPAPDGGIIAAFSAKELSQGEADGSALPSGGLRATFEARGYTAWDPTSPAFIKSTNGVKVLCVPTVFYGHHGEALDKKTPLLRSHAALSKQLARLGKIFGEPCDHIPRAELGAEQEYFLVRKEHFHARPDLLQTGRTLFGRRPPRHQQMMDHYYGAIPPAVLAFMRDVDSELWRLGVPSKTRHNEASPGQFELVPMHEDQNLAVDHNMLVMQVLCETADRHGFACLLHEKPFAGVNGSGKHNNWSITGTDGKNGLAPGKTPHENLKFLALLAAVIKGVDVFADLLRASVATAGNEARLGACEAPPTVVSIFLG